MIRFRLYAFLILLFSIPYANAEPAYDFIFGIATHSVSLSINSLQENSDTTSLHSDQSFNPSLIVRSPFNKQGEFLFYHYGYYIEYGLDSVNLSQGEIFDAYTSFGYIDPATSVDGWYARIHPILALRSGHLTMGMGFGLSYTYLDGDFMVEWNSRAPGRELLHWSELAISWKLFIEGESRSLVWGMRYNPLYSSEAAFDYSLGIFSLYLGYKF